MLGGEERMKEGTEMMESMGKWARNNASLFENKWLLLRAERASVARDDAEAQSCYEASIRAAKDNGSVHELGMAYECFANFHLVRGRNDEALLLVKKSYGAFTQWGATAVAKRLLAKHGLDAASIGESELHAENGSKRSRE